MHQQVVITTAAVTVVGIATAVYFIWKKKQMSRDKNYVKVGKIGKIYFHPIKSLKGVEVQKAKCTKSGLEVDSLHERSFMLVIGNGNFITMRREPSLSLLTVRLDYPYLYIDGPNMTTLKIPLKRRLLSSDGILRCKVWGKEIGAVDCGDEPALWFQKYLGKPNIRLVRHFPKMSLRPASDKSDERHKLTDYPIVYQDETPFHILSQPSIDDLNSRLDLENKISSRNFRPNLLVVNCEPYEEDKWKHIKVSSGAKFIYLKHCDRCVMTTVNQETGIKTDIEPLKTLRTYRLASHLNLSPKFQQAPLFGTSLGLEGKGEVKVGDDVFALLEY